MLDFAKILKSVFGLKNFDNDKLTPSVFAVFCGRGGGASEGCGNHYCTFIPLLKYSGVFRRYCPGSATEIDQLNSVTPSH